MPTCHASARPTRVLTVLPTQRFTGLAVLDGAGIVPGGFASWNLRAAKSKADRILILRKRFASALSRFHPTVVVLGIPSHSSASSMEMWEAVQSIALAHGLPVVHRRVVESRRLLLGRAGGSTKNALPERLVRGFFPSLASWNKGVNSSRYRCHAFSALALSLHELALRAPLFAAAISNTEALSMCSWNAFLAEQTRNLYPQEDL
jgi:hypothetical protein